MNATSYDVFFLLLGLIIGIRFSDFWQYFKLSNCSERRQYIANHRPTPAPLGAFLFNRTRILCFVLTTSTNHATKAVNVKDTWGRRCNKLLFISNTDDAELGAVHLNVTEGCEHLFEKTRAALEYIYERYLDDYDWFFKTDDDTYVIMENLRVFLYPYDAEAPVYFGCKFKPYVDQGYMSGGSGYVLSREAVRRFNLFAKNNSNICSVGGGGEDLNLGRCLQNVGVVAGDSRDALGRERFLPLAPRFLMPVMPNDTWYAEYLFFKPNLTDCCSYSAISFHYTESLDFYMYELLLYAFRVFGLENPGNRTRLPRRLSATEMERQLQLWASSKSDNVN